MKSTVTDLDYFVALGHSEVAVREALRVTNGNRNAALYILVKGDTGSRDANSAWRKEMPEDWQFGVAKHVPNIAENRALHKSPIFIFLESYRPVDVGNDYEFVMKVTLKDGREWKISKTYSQFSSFKFSLPFGTCFYFKNSFPQPTVAGSVFGDFTSAFLARRLHALAEWMRELVLNEACMSSAAVLDLLYAFIDADAHGGRVGLSPSSPVTPPSPASNTQKANTWSPPPAPSPLLAAAYDTQHAAALKQKQHYYSQARLLGNEQLPLSLEQVAAQVPVKVNVKKLQCYADLQAAKKPKPSGNKAAQNADSAVEHQEPVDAAGSDHNINFSSMLSEMDLVQLRKDCQRDRIVVQGRRFEGSHTDLDSILQACRESALEVIARSGRSTVILAPKKVTVPPPAGVLSMEHPPVEAVQERESQAVVQDAPRAASPAEHVADSVDANVDGELAELAAPNYPPPPIPTAGPAAAAPVVVKSSETVLSSSTSASTSAPSEIIEEVGFDALGKCALQMISRTESAYLSHASLHEILDMQNVHQVASFQPYLFVPESTLAEPLELRFSTLERNNLTVARSRFTRAVADEWCVECHGETSTVYRLLDALDLQPLLQLRVTYVVTLFGMPKFQSGPLSAVTGLTVKEGKCQLIINKATTTTSRDWAKPKV